MMHVKFIFPIFDAVCENVILYKKSQIIMSMFHFRCQGNDKYVVNVVSTVALKLVCILPITC